MDDFSNSHDRIGTTDEPFLTTEMNQSGPRSERSAPASKWTGTPAGAGPPSAKDFRLTHLRDVGLDRGSQWLIHGLMPTGGIHVLYGAPGSGKSFVALNAALHVASGREWAGRRVRDGGVIYVAAEGGRAFRKRVYAAREELRLPAETPFGLIVDAPDLGKSGVGHDERFAARNTAELMAAIDQQVEVLGARPSLIVIDTLSRSLGDLDESNSTDMMALVENVTRIEERFNALVLVVHHSGKDEARGMRGSSALHGAVSAEWLVTWDPDSGKRYITVQKMKDGPDQGRATFDLLPRILGSDESREDIQTCVVRIDGGFGKADPEQTRVRRNTKDDDLLAALRMHVAVAGESAAVGSGAPEGARVVDRSGFRKAAVAAGLVPEKNTVYRDIETLVEKRWVGRQGESIWVLPG